MSPTAPAIALNRTRAPAQSSGAWRLSAAIPAGWGGTIDRLDAGYFLSPPALVSSFPRGEPVFASLEADGEVRGIALGVARACTLSRRARHYYFATPPRVGPVRDSGEAVNSLLHALKRRGAAEVIVDSFDAAGVTDTGATRRGRERQEYLVDLRASPDDLLGRFGATHRRHVRRGERERWTVRHLSAGEGAAALAAVQSSASERAIERGEHLTALPEMELHFAPAELGEPWGALTFAAFADDGSLLGAALVGWAGQRAYYLIGGSTPAGYHKSAATWLHWRIMCTLARTGCALYNLGGTAAAAAAAGEAGHGLYRFKSGFSGQVVSCRSAAWQMLPLHGLAHAAVGKLKNLLSSSRP